MKKRVYGQGRWHRAQLYAIVATYWRQERDEEWVAKRLGVSPGLVHQIYLYVEYTEGLSGPDAGRGTDGRAACAPNGAQPGRPPAHSPPV